MMISFALYVIRRWIVLQNTWESEPNKIVQFLTEVIPQNDTKVVLPEIDILVPK